LWQLKELVELRSFAQTIICQQELIIMRQAASLSHREDAAIENRRLGEEPRGTTDLSVVADT
jgi:hypothetical protein